MTPSENQSTPNINNMFIITENEDLRNRIKIL
jgi:hypothetical protein